MLDRTPENFIALKNIEGQHVGIDLPLNQAHFPVPFYQGLEYPPPARGGWNIVHIGLTLPQAHLIFVCPEGCLRGVVLSAAELDLAQRFSTIAVGEENVLEGDMEAQVIEGVSHIIEELPQRPPAVLVYTSCIHQFLGSDIDLIYSQLRQRFPDIDFTDCYMFPIMRKSGPNPVEMMRQQLYSLLTPLPKDPMAVNIIGSDYPLPHDSDLYQLLTRHGFSVHEIGTCQDYAAYKQMAASSVNISILPSAIKAGELLAKNLGQTHVYLPLSFDYGEIEARLAKLCATLQVPYTPDKEAVAQAESALKQAQAVIGQTPIAIDYSAGPRPLSLTRMLLTHGFNVTDVYADAFEVEEQADFDKLQQLKPDLMIHPTEDVQMRVAPRKRSEKTLAIGQKAAYFTGSDYFVNIIEGDGMYGISAITRLAHLMIAAFETPKDTAALISVKALNWGCSCVL